MAFGLSKINYLGLCEWKKYNISLVYLDLKRIRGGKLASSFSGVQSFGFFCFESAKIRPVGNTASEANLFFLPIPCISLHQIRVFFSRGKGKLPLLFILSVSHLDLTLSYNTRSFKARPFFFNKPKFRHSSMAYCCKIYCGHCKFV